MAWIKAESALGQHKDRTTPTVTVVGRSSLRLSAAALELLGAADRVDVWYDTDSRALAFEPSDAGTFKLTRRPTGGLSAAAAVRALGLHNGDRSTDVTQRDGRVVVQFAAAVSG